MYLLSTKAAFICWAGFCSAFRRTEDAFCGFNLRHHPFSRCLASSSANCGPWRFRFYIYFYFPWLIAVFTQNKMTSANCTLASINFEGLVLVSCRGDNIESDTNNVHFPSLENEKRKDAITTNLHYESRASGTNSHL